MYVYDKAKLKITIFRHIYYNFFILILFIYIVIDKKIQKIIKKEN